MSLNRTEQFIVTISLASAIVLLGSTFTFGEPFQQLDVTSVQSTINAEIERRLQATAMEATISAGVIDAAQATSQGRVTQITQTASYATEIARATARAIATQSAINETRFFTDNALREQVNRTSSGLQYQVIVQGAGPTATADDLVTLSYRISLISGERIFDLNDWSNGTIVGHVGSTIPGLEEGLSLMQAGATYRFWLPSLLAFGPYSSGEGGLPPNAPLVLDVTLIDIQQSPASINEIHRQASYLPGTHVQTDEDQLRLRARPGIDSELVAYLPLGDTGFVFMGPVRSDGLAWFNVWFPHGGSGWVAADYIHGR